MLVLLMEGIYDLCTDAMIGIPSFTEIGSGIQKLIWGIHVRRPIDTQIERQQGDLINLFLFCQKKKVG
jgi:hypothetical protein